MLSGKQEVRVRSDVNYYTARKLEDMARSMERLAKAFDEGMGKESGLTRDDGLAAMETSAAMVCGDCSQCGIYMVSRREDSYYLYYLLRAFEQKGQIEKEDMPKLFQADCRKKEDYLSQLNRSLARATMNLSWKNRFLESRDAVVSQFREMSLILGEFSHQIDQAADVTSEYGYIMKKLFRRCHVAVENMLILEYESGRREAYVTARTTNGRCMTAKDAAGLMGEVVPGTKWNPARDSRSIITRQTGTVRFEEEGEYQLLYGAARVPRQGERYSGDNYTFCESPGSQAMISLCDGMGCGEQAGQESRQVVELTEGLLEAGFGPRAAFKLVNTVLLLAGAEQHPAALDVSCVDLYTGVLDVMKLGAAPTFVLGQEGAEVLEAGQGPAGILNGAEPVMLSRKLWDGDHVIMVTDGVLDALPGEDKEQAMCQYLESMEFMTPQEMAERILEFALSFVPGARDDMTVLTAAIWKKE